MLDTFKRYNATYGTTYSFTFTFGNYYVLCSTESDGAITSFNLHKKLSAPESFGFTGNQVKEIERDVQAMIINFLIEKGELKNEN